MVSALVGAQTIFSARHPGADDSDDLAKILLKFSLKAVAANC